MDLNDHFCGTDQLHVAFCANDRFLPGLAVALHSAMLNMPHGCKVNIHIVDVGLSEESKSSLCERYSGLTDMQIKFHEWPKNLFASVAAVKYHISAYLRLSLPELIGARKVVYLDSDTIVFGDISFLKAELQNSSLPIAATPDWETKSLAQDSKVIASHMNLETCKSYFNSGVLVLDLDLLRAEKFTERALALLGELGEFASYADQTAFNALLADRWHELPAQWNTPSWAFDKKKGNGLPEILHYTNSAPWLNRRFTPSQALYERIAEGLGVDLPRPETSLLQSCLSDFAVWLVAPWRVLLNLLRGLLSKAAGRPEAARGSLRIVRHWCDYFFGGPLRVVRYWRRIRKIKSPSFDPFARNCS